MLFPYGHCQLGQGGVNVAQMVWSTFFPRPNGQYLLEGGQNACQDGLEHFFSTFVRSTEGGGYKVIRSMPIKNQHVSKRGFPYNKRPFSRFPNGNL